MHIANKPAFIHPFYHPTTVNKKILWGLASKQKTFFERLPKISTAHFNKALKYLKVEIWEKGCTNHTETKTSTLSLGSPQSLHDREVTSSSDVDPSLNQGKPSNFPSLFSVIKTNRSLRCNFLFWRTVSRAFLRLPNTLLCSLYFSFSPNISIQCFLCPYTHIYTLILNIENLVMQ